MKLQKPRFGQLSDTSFTKGTPDSEKSDLMSQTITS